MDEQTLTLPDDDDGLAAILEALLFVAEDPVAPRDLASATGASAARIAGALDALERALEGRALRLQRGRDAVQLVSAPEHAPWIERFLGLDLSSRLSTAALETLAIIAYRQPVTRVEIDALRGVNSSGTLRTLLQRELVEEVGRLETVGHPYLYGTTPTFLQYFGLRSLDELPPLDPEQGAALFRERESE